MPKISFAKVEDQKEWTPAPSGEYVLELVDYKDGTIQSGDNKGQDKTSLTWEIVEAEGELERYNGRRIYETATYGPKALPRIKTMLKSFGAEVDDSENADEVDWDWDELLGQKVRAKIRSVPAQRDKNDPSKEYPAKNVIVRYLLDEEDEDE